MVKFRYSTRPSVHRSESNGQLEVCRSLLLFASLHCANSIPAIRPRGATKMWLRNCGIHRPTNRRTSYIERGGGGLGRVGESGNLGRGHKSRSHPHIDNVPSDKVPEAVRLRGKTRDIHGSTPKRSSSFPAYGSHGFQWTRLLHKRLIRLEYSLCSQSVSCRNCSWYCLR